jgi:ribose transport system ATP-binding protein
LNGELILKMEGICKRFPGVLALDHVRLEVRRGEVHALLGENGAGKSTLLKILSGAYSKDAGEVFIDGKLVHHLDTKKAEELGIAIIYQEFSTLPHLSVAENIFLANQPLKKNGFSIDWEKCNEESKRILSRVGLDIEPTTLISDLKIAQQQMVEIAKALSKNARIIVMDEPTAPLTQREIENLFAVIQELKADGVSIIYVSHRLAEIKQICDRITFLRDGKYVGEAQTNEIDINSMVRMMVGRELTEMFPKILVPIGEELLRVEHLCTSEKLYDITFSVHKGEIVGIAGLVGAGRTELARAIYGADQISSGEIFMNKARMTSGNIRESIRQGIGLMPEDRKHQGLVLLMSVSQNITLASLRKFAFGFHLSPSKEDIGALEYVHRLRIATPSIYQETSYLSGGNQQKVVLSKWLCAQCKLLIIDEPTRGIDVGAKKEIYELMGELASMGMGIIMISSEMQELIGICDRILVMHEGRITGELSREQFSEETIMNYATGQTYKGTRLT